MADEKKPDRRKAPPRSRALLSGKLVFDNANQSIDCTIRDLTQRGAKVKISTVTPLPSHLYLIDIKRGLAFESEVIWSRPPELGLKFLKSHNLQEDLNSPLLKGMRRIWVELAAR